MNRKETVCHFIFLQERNSEGQVYHGEQSAQIDQCPDDGDAVLAHGVQKGIGRSCNGNGKSSVLSDGVTNKKHANQGRNREFVKSSVV